VTHRTGAGARINADNIWLYRLIVLGVVVAAGAAVLTSWNGLVYVAAWQGLLPEWRWITPVMIDVPIVVLTLGALAKRSRGESPALFIILALGLTGVSAAANFLHTVADRGLDDYSDWGGATLNSIAPALVLLTTEVLGQLVTRPKRVPRSRRRKSAVRRSRAARPVVVAAPALIDVEDVA
jgi:hypothetical protein